MDHNFAWEPSGRADMSLPPDEFAWRRPCNAGGMSKHNVNPDHYKVACRERQGEDILQARNKQKFAQSVVRERFEMHQAVPAGTSPAYPSTFPSAPSVASAWQKSGSSGEMAAEPGDDVSSSRRAAALARRADRHSPLAERRVYREEAIRIQHEDARHEHEDTIRNSPEKGVSGHRQEVCRIRWKEGVQRRSEETLGFPTEVNRRREEARRSGRHHGRRTTRNR